MAKLSFPFLVEGDLNVEGIPSGCPQGDLYRGHRLKIQPVDDFLFDMETIEKDIKEQRGDE